MVRSSTYTAATESSVLEVGSSGREGLACLRQVAHREPADVVVLVLNLLREDGTSCFVGPELRR